MWCFKRKFPGSSAMNLQPSRPPTKGLDPKGEDSKIMNARMVILYSLKLTFSHLKIDPGKGDSYWKPSFLGAMLAAGSVTPTLNIHSKM